MCESRRECGKSNIPKQAASRKAEIVVLLQRTERRQYMLQSYSWLSIVNKTDVIRIVPIPIHTSVEGTGGYDTVCPYYPSVHLPLDHPTTSAADITQRYSHHTVHPALGERRGLLLCWAVPRPMAQDDLSLLYSSESSLHSPRSLVSEAGPSLQK